MVIRELHGLELNMVIQRLFENEYGYSLVGIKWIWLFAERVRLDLTFKKYHL